MAVKLSALRAGHPLPVPRFLVLISVRGWVDPRDIVRLEELDQLTNPMISSGIEPATPRTSKWSFEFHKIIGIYRMPEQLLASQEGLGPTEFCFCDWNQRMENAKNMCRLKTCRLGSRVVAPARSLRAVSHDLALLIMCLDAKRRRLIRQLIIYQTGVRAR
jgi:hypothetical protein